MTQIPAWVAALGIVAGIALAVLIYAAHPA
jgi:hypothetical protein